MRAITKTLVICTSLLLFCISTFSQQVAKTISNAISPNGIIGFLQFTPPDYGTQKHPLIIFLHGVGERGNGTTQIGSVANNGTPYYCGHGATMRFTVSGVTSSFVVLSPQLHPWYGAWPTFYVKEMINYAKANLQIDTNRIYVTGLSLGGGGIWGLITENYGSTFDATIAAAAPVCGTQEEVDPNFCSTIGANHLPVWAFHAMDDGTVNVGATQHAEILASMCGITPAPKFTYYQSGNHSGAWINAYDTGHITRTLSNGSSFTANPNLYEWFLSKTRATAPFADAGPSQNISATSTVLNSTGSYSPNGAISSYTWQQVSGPGPANIVDPTSSTTVIDNMINAGNYSFKLTVTDAMGISGFATTAVNVMIQLLPVEFTSLSVEKASTGNLLHWQTAHEQNSDVFIIERSTDSKVFAACGQIAASGAGHASMDYAYTDAKAPAGTVYYRVKEVDKDGKFSYSKLVMVAADSRHADLQLYPNPLSDNLNIVVSNEVKGNGKIVVYESTGRVVAERPVTKSATVLDAAVNMNGLASGLYIVEVKIGESYKITRHVIKK